MKTNFGVPTLWDTCILGQTKTYVLKGQTGFCPQQTKANRCPAAKNQEKRTVKDLELETMEVSPSINGKTPEWMR